MNPILSTETPSSTPSAATGAAGEDAFSGIDAGMLHYYRASLLDATGRVTEALEAYEQALALDNDLADAHYRLGVLYEQLNEPVASMWHFQAYQKLVGARAERVTLN
ncbi:tetratricopeptide repeat protein [Mitsuaria sp. GD03876]|uniref:tetratricopeptide repeat protein n=1 Tax=Mitsuaria sp. GD03876 TaxID=2975399 RepID=UPI00244A250E|nr:tetratricopeptide repeat protein [Mitsuaria sp. GD03876]MDH0865240.1 tetratricopeptide repeat protein [Mitsuaria sp. GD03876]